MIKLQKLLYVKIQSVLKKPKKNPSVPQEPENETGIPLKIQLKITGNEIKFIFITLKEE